MVSYGDFRERVEDRINEFETETVASLWDSDIGQIARDQILQKHILDNTPSPG